MTETAMEGGWRSSTTTTTVIDSKNGDVVQLPARSPKKTVTDNLYTTFSSPLAWILVLALIITWSAVAVIMFDLLDQKQLTGNIHHMGSDPMKSVGKAVEESTSWANGVLAFITDLLSPDEDEGDLAHAVKKKGEFLPSKKKALPQAKETKERKGKEVKVESQRERRKSKTMKRELKEEKSARKERKAERREKPVDRAKAGPRQERARRTKEKKAAVKPKEDKKEEPRKKPTRKSKELKREGESVKKKAALDRRRAARSEEKAVKKRQPGAKPVTAKATKGECIFIDRYYMLFLKTLLNTLCICVKYV
uniref:Triadin n=1 Tax=Paramormyrops kingsleyae TaxID=1676925 RepID=A0A3B3ST22_9TELE